MRMNGRAFTRFTSVAARTAFSGLELLSRDALKNIEPHAEGVAALLSPETGIVDYRDVAEKLGERIEHAGGTIRRSALVTGLERRSGSTIVVSSAGDVEARRVVCCAGLQADRVAKFSDGAKKLLIVPFRGEYYRLKPHRRCLVQNLIYPVPDPRFPFLGVHFTRRVDGEIEAGPNAVLAFAREGYRKMDVDWRDVGEMLRFAGFWRMGIKHWTRAALEYYRSLSKGAFIRGLKTASSLRSQAMISKWEARVCALWPSSPTATSWTISASSASTTSSMS